MITLAKLANHTRMHSYPQNPIDQLSFPFPQTTHSNAIIQKVKARLRCYEK